MNHVKPMNMLKCLKNLSSIPFQLFFILDLFFACFKPVFEIMRIIHIFHKQYNFIVAFGVVIELDDVLVFEAGMNCTFFSGLRKLELSKQLMFINGFSNNFLVQITYWPYQLNLRSRNTLVINSFNTFIVVNNCVAFGIVLNI